MLKRALAIILGAAACAALPAAGEDLIQIYRDAVANDPTLASARANWTATQEVVPQALANLLPAVNLAGAANTQNFRRLHNVDPGFSFSTQFPQYDYTVSPRSLTETESSPTIRRCKGRPERLCARIRTAGPHRAGGAGISMCSGPVQIELTESQKAAVSENPPRPAQLRGRPATITDTNDAQAKYDQIVAQELSVQNDLDNRLASLAAIIGRPPKELKRFRGGFQPELPTPNAVDRWIEMAMRDNPQVQIAKSNYDIAVLEVDRQRAGHLPTLDLVASFNQPIRGFRRRSVASAAAFIPGSSLSAYSPTCRCLAAGRSIRRCGRQWPSSRRRGRTSRPRGAPHSS
jgi:outer membrane protein